jgi:hypothetical protein
VDPWRPIRSDYAIKPAKRAFAQTPEVLVPTLLTRKPGVGESKSNVWCSTGDFPSRCTFRPEALGGQRAT